jgi:hypothetical protein
MNPPGVRQSGALSPADVISRRTSAASLLTRVTARLLAARYDRMLAVGVFASPGSGLDVHARRLTTIAEREAIARSLRRSLREVRNPIPQWTARSWTHRPNVMAAADVIDTVTLRLHSPRPVDTRGMARLRLLLSDGTGPLYMCGRGDLVGRLHAALAAL